MELAGFSFSPSTRQRLYETLATTGIHYLEKPEKLKYILAPVIVRTAAEQKLFYQIFDSYFEEIQQPIEIEKTTKIQWWKTLPTWIWIVIPTLLILSGLGYGIYKLLEPEPPQLKAFFQHESIVRIGDTLVLNNISENADSLSEFIWQIFDGENEVPEIVDNQLVDFVYVVDTLHGSPDKMVYLIAKNKELAQIDTFQSVFKIHCSDSPEIKLNPENTDELLKIETVYEFAVLNKEKDLDFEWSFGEDQTKKGAQISHVFEKSGTAEITLKVTRENRKAYCFQTLKIPITIEQSKAFLAYKPLLKDEIRPTANFTSKYWALLGALIIGLFWYLQKWLKRKAPEREKEKQPAKIALKAADRGPYFIPFYPQNKLIKIDRTLFRLADTLRLRQKGIRQKIDIKQTIKTTIESGGFPNLAVSSTTRPTEYLFLIDELARESHQTKLFIYLADFLRARDVLVEVFYYKNDLTRFWNKDHKTGISLSILQRLFPNYRAVVLGDGHDFLDPFAKGQPVLKKEVATHLKAWKHRVLLTPTPLVSWNYQEKVLFQHFDIFPADMAGLEVAMTAFEQGRDEEEHPKFKNWIAQFEKKQAETDIRYRKWRRLSDYEDFLKNHPKVLLWLKALAVYPQPNWSLTLAIGEALKPFGVEVTYDNLLLLSRIPWLQDGVLSPKLRKVFLASLPLGVEDAARVAVKVELEAVEDLIQNSHAAVAHQSNLAIQNFVLAPQDTDNHIFIKGLLDANLLSKKQIKELEDGLQRHFEKENSPSTIKRSSVKSNIDFAPEPPDLASFLVENEPEEKPLFRPFFTTDLLKSALFGLGTLLGVILFFTLNQTDSLYQLTFKEKPTPAFKKQEEMRHTLFVDEKIVVDSAVIYNNEGSQYEALRSFSRFDNPEQKKQPLSMTFEAAEASFKNALRVRKSYPLATHNLAKLYYNEGARKYHQTIRDSVSTDSLEQSFVHFYQATQTVYDSLFADGYHGMGLTDYYSKNYLKADSTLAFIEKNTNKQFFDTLSLSPNLKTLLADRNFLNLSQTEGNAQRQQDSLNLITKRKRQEEQILKKQQAAAAQRRKDSLTLATPKINLPQKPTNEPSKPPTVNIFSISGKYGLKDENDNTILKATYDGIKNFGAIFPDLAEVYTGKQYGFINKAGKLAIPLEYEGFILLYNKNRPLKDVVIIKKNKQEGVMDKNGKIIIPPEYDGIALKSADRFRARREGVDFFFDKKGKPIE